MRFENATYTSTRFGYEKYEPGTFNLFTAWLLLTSRRRIIELSIFHDKISLIPNPSPGGRRETSSLSLRERNRG
jgi:hypothetical protein